jgi:Concanavalin A-like lectin/glucanases superfamily/Tyrosine-protein kinase ephrin type A/B receptor-like
MRAILRIHGVLLTCAISMVNGQASLCSPGFYGPSGSSTCTACPSNTYSSNGALSCLPNPGYWYGNEIPASAMSTNTQTIDGVTISITCPSDTDTCSGNAAARLFDKTSAGVGMYNWKCDPANKAVCGVNSCGTWYFQIDTSASRLFSGYKVSGGDVSKFKLDGSTDNTNYFSYDDPACRYSGSTLLNTGTANYTKYFDSWTSARYLRFYIQAQAGSWWTASIGELALYTTIPVQCTGTCSAGTFVRCGLNGTAVCCGAGTFFVESQSTACVTCSAGSFGDGSKTSCTPCAPGSYSAAGASACTVCPAGTYSPKTGTTSLSDCVPCSPGRYGSLTGQGTELDACPNECPSGQWSPPGSTAANACQVVAAPQSGNVFALVTSSTTNAFYKFDLTSSASPTISTFNMPTGANALYASVIAPDGTYAIIFDDATKRVYRMSLDSTSNSAQIVAGSGSNSRVDGVGTAAAFYVALDCAISIDGTYVLIADYGNHAIRRMTLTAANGIPQYTVTTIVGTCSGVSVCTQGALNGPGLSSTLDGPAGIDIHPSQRWFVISEYNGHRIRTVSLIDGIYTTSTLAGTGTAGSVDGSFSTATFKSPQGITFSSDGTKIVVMDRDNKKLRLLDLTTQLVSTLFTATSGDTRQVAYSLLGDHLFYVDMGSQVVRYSFSTGTTSAYISSGVTSAYNIAIWRPNVAGYGSDTSSATIVKCPAGKYSFGGVCVICPAGTWSSAGAFQCTSCAAGTYRTSSGGTAASDCLSCPLGTWSPVASTSASACIGCSSANMSAISLGSGTQFTDVPGYRVHRYTATGATTVSFSRDVVADVLIVGGGGGSGVDMSGGGGAGAVLYYAGIKFFASKAYTFTVGAGGAGSTVGSSSGKGTVGGDSGISDVSSLFTARGGGGGATFNSACNVADNKGLNGGSGGGGSTCTGTPGTGDLAGGGSSSSNIMSTINGYTLGFSGGAGIQAGGLWKNAGAGGGGGASSAGGSASGETPGSGGDGVHQVTWGGSTYSLQGLWGIAYTSISQLEADGKYYIGGGGGGGGHSQGGTASSVPGGKGGGGKGSDDQSSSSVCTNYAPTTGKDNTGSGGGGTCTGASGKAGGSGLILIRYSSCQPCGSGTQLSNPGSNGLCSPCNSGTYSWSGASTCQTCPANSAAGPGSDRCTATVGNYPKHSLDTSYPFMNLARSCGANGNSACTTSQSSQADTWASTYGNNGIINAGGDFAITNSGTDNWWRVDFGTSRAVGSGKIWPQDLTSRTSGFKIWIGDTASAYNAAGNINCYTNVPDGSHFSNPRFFDCFQSGRYLWIHNPNNNNLGFTEIEIYPYYQPTTTGKLLVINNDFVSDSFWGLSGSVTVVYPANIHPTALIASPLIPPSISDNDYPVVTDGTTGQVLRPYVWYKFDTTSCLTDSGTSGVALTAPTGIPGTCSIGIGKRGDAAANFVSASLQNFKISVSDAAAMNLPQRQRNTGLTIAFWGLMRTATTTWGRLFEFVVSTGDDTGTVGVLGLMRNAATSDIIWYHDAARHTFTGRVDGMWHHYALSIATDGTWTVWLDNIKQTTTLQYNLHLKSGTQVYTYRIASEIGRISLLDGSIDDFRIYDRVLTDAQVNTLYQGRVGIYTPSFGSCPDTTTCTTGSKHCNSTGDKVCCVAGQFLRDGVDGTCQQCPLGTYSTDGSGTSCTSCSVGSTTASTGSTASSACVACSGTCSSGIKRCLSTTSSVCCGSNGVQQFFRDNLDTQCQNCSTGLYGDGSGTFCVAQCPAGQYMSGGACVLCPAGTYRSTTGATSLAECLTCPQYSYSPYKGATACTACAANV